MAELDRPRILLVDDDRIPLRAVELGMVLAEDIQTASGELLLARGQEITPTLIERIMNLALDSRTQHPVLVSLP